MKTNHTITRLCVFGLFWLMILSQTVYAQTEKKVTKEYPKQSVADRNVEPGTLTAAEQLKSFKHNSHDTRLSKLEHSLLIEKASLEASAQNRLTGSEMSEIQSRISNIEKAISEHKEMKAEESRKMQEIDRVKNAINDRVISDPAELRAYKQNVTYITVADYQNAPYEKQVLILENPDSYIVVKNASLIPQQTMSKAQYNSLTPQRKQMINDRGVKIVD